MGFLESEQVCNNPTLGGMLLTVGADVYMYFCAYWHKIIRYYTSENQLRLFKVHTMVSGNTHLHFQTVNEDHWACFGLDTHQDMVREKNKKEPLLILSSPLERNKNNPVQTVLML